MSAVGNCPFCNLPGDRRWLANEVGLAFFDGYPITEGHALIIPRRHVASLFDLGPGEQSALWMLVSEVREELKAKFKADAFTIGINDGIAAGQTILHAHIHVIPRRSGDVADPRGGVRWIIKQLLTTQRVVATKSDDTYFGRRLTEEEQAAAVAAKKKDEEAQGQKLKELKTEIAGLEAKLKVDPKDEATQKSLDRQKKLLEAVEKKAKVGKGNRQRGNPDNQVDKANLDGPKTYARVSRPSFGAGSMKPKRILATAPEGQRLGILTHPAWLVSQSDAMDNHAIHRGIWIRERLLGGGIPDVPITVDAQLPDEPHNTLRDRMRVTKEKYCWTCHQKMDPLGLPFEMYNHAGLFRTTELDKPVNTTGEIIDSGDPKLDGPVSNALEMIKKLADSERVEQVFVRHAFRFWMGRNETLNDAPVLQAAHRAYRDSGGSMKALIKSLVTSDAFLYRKMERAEPVRASGG